METRDGHDIDLRRTASCAAQGLLAAPFCTLERRSLGPRHFDCIQGASAISLEGNNRTVQTLRRPLGMGCEVGRAARNAEPWSTEDTTLTSVDCSDALPVYAHATKIYGRQCRSV